MKYLKIKQTCDRTQLDRKTIYRMIESGELPASKIGRVYRIAESDLEAFMESMKAKTLDARAA